MNKEINIIYTEQSLSVPKLRFPAFGDDLSSDKPGSITTSFCKELNISTPF